MKSSVTNNFIIAAGVLLASMPASGSITSVFSDAADVGNLSNFEDGGGTVTGDTGEGLATSSPIGSGDALLFWDLGATGRGATVSYDFAPTLSPFQVDLTYYIDTAQSAGVAQGGFNGLIFSIANEAQPFQNNGSFRGFETRLYVDGSISNGGVAGPVDAAANLSYIFNPAASGDLAYTDLDGAATLGAQSWVAYRDGVQIAAGSFDGAEANWDPTLGVGIFGIHSGGNLSGQAPTTYIDNIVFRDGADIGVTVIPEPNLIATFFGLFFVGAILFRRRR